MFDIMRIFKFFGGQKEKTSLFFAPKSQEKLMVIAATLGDVVHHFQRSRDLYIGAVDTHDMFGHVMPQLHWILSYQNKHGHLPEKIGLMTYSPTEAIADTWETILKDPTGTNQAVKYVVREQEKVFTTYFADEEGYRNASTGAHKKVTNAVVDIHIGLARSFDTFFQEGYGSRLCDIPEADLQNITIEELQFLIAEKNSCFMQ